MEKLAGVVLTEVEGLMDRATEWEVTEEILEVVDDQQAAHLYNLPA
jgi:hypothetical protein